VSGGAGSDSAGPVLTAGALVVDLFLELFLPFLILFLVVLFLGSAFSKLFSLGFYLFENAVIVGTETALTVLDFVFV
jgi:hypothetical protein